MEFNHNSLIITYMSQLVIFHVLIQNAKPSNFLFQW